MTNQDDEWDRLFLEEISYHGHRTERQLVQLAAFNGLSAESTRQWLLSAEERELIERVRDFWRICR